MADNRKKPPQRRRKSGKNAPQRAARLPTHARAVAAQSVQAVLRKKQMLDPLFDDLSAKLDPRDRAFALDLTLTTLRRAGAISKLVKQLVDKPVGHGLVQAVLFTGLAQILILGIADHAAVSESVDLVKSDPVAARYAGLVNAVLRRIIRERAIWVQLLDENPLDDMPFWIAENWGQAYGADMLQSMALALRSVPNLDLSFKNAATKSAFMAAAEQAIDLPLGSVRLPAGRVDKLPGYADGSWWVQDFAAHIPALLLGGIMGKHVLDMCAAPGGKTLQLAALGADVTALDRSENRLKILQQNLDRTGLSAHIAIGDATSYQPDRPVDHILLDAPCSALGTYRRHPDGLWSKGPKDVAKLADLQARMLDHAATLLQPGGKLVYCVCSLDPSEGVQQIAAFLDRQPQMHLAPISLDILPDDCHKDGQLIIHPGNIGLPGGCDGFQIATLVKT